MIQADRARSRPVPLARADPAAGCPAGSCCDPRAPARAHWASARSWPPAGSRAPRRQQRVHARPAASAPPPGGPSRSCTTRSTSPTGRITSTCSRASTPRWSTSPRQTGIQVNYTEPINDNVPFYAKIRPSLQAKQSTGYDIIVMTNNSPPLGYLIAVRLADPARPQHDDQLRQVRGPADQEPVLGPGQQVHDGLAVRLDRDRLQLLGGQEPGHQRRTSCSTRSTRARSA